MPYTYITFDELVDQLAARIGDTSQTFWVRAELFLYIDEALRIWGAMTAYWRENGTFQTSAGVASYALQSALTNGSGTNLLGQSVTDRNLIQQMQYHFLENASSQSVWLGTDMFTLGDLSSALQRSRDQFLRDTGCVVTVSTMNMPPPPVAVVNFDDTIIDVRRVVWRDTDLVPTLLWRSDTWEETSASSTWTYDPGTPQDWLLLAKPLQLKVAPPPNASGSLELVTVNAGPALDPATAATVMGLPDSLVWAAKWGAISDLLTSEGQAGDEQRANFAQNLYDMAVEIALKLPTVFYQECVGIPGFISSLADLDAGYPDWQGGAQESPEDVGLAGLNVAYVRPVPDAAYNILLTTARNAPVSSDGGSVQIGREELNAILDIAQCIAAFKQGGAEFNDTLTQAQDAFKQARKYVARLNANILTLNILAGLATREEAERPRSMEPEPEAAPQ